MIRNQFWENHTLCGSFEMCLNPQWREIENFCWRLLRTDSTFEIQYGTANSIRPFVHVFVLDTVFVISKRFVLQNCVRFFFIALRIYSWEIPSVYIQCGSHSKSNYTYSNSIYTRIEKRQLNKYEFFKTFSLFPVIGTGLFIFEMRTIFVRFCFVFRKS